MQLICRGIYDRGNFALEGIHFRALVDIDLRFYAVFDTKLIDTNRLFVGNRTCYWFASQPLKAGDNIVFYTRAGSPSVEKRSDGTIFNFVSTGLTQPLYSPK